MPNKPAPKRRLRFTLKGFLVFISAIAIATALWAERARKQQSAVRLVERHGGSVQYRDLNVFQTWLCEANPFGIDGVMSAGAMYFGEETDTDTLLDVLRHTDPVVVVVRGDHVTDAVIVEISKEPAVAAVTLYRTRQVSREAFRYFKRCHTLKKLWAKESSLDAELAEELQLALPDCKIQFGPRPN